MKAATCEVCKRGDVPVMRGKLGAHGDAYTARCRGSGDRPAEVRANARARRLAKKKAGIDAVRGDASVVLDALLNGRDDLDAEFDLANFRALAAREYKLLTNQRLPTYGTHWTSRREHHDLYCVFCGYSIVTLRRGYWSQLTIEERSMLLESHTTICALQLLAGIRDPVALGTTLQDPSHVLLSSKTVVPPELAKACSECEAPYGLPCVGTSKSKKTDGGQEARLRRRKRPHDVRRG